jgi:rod shape determining protein RodA
LGALLLLTITLLFGTTIRNTKAWIVVGPFQFQTAELAKIALIVFLAYFFARRHVGIGQIRNIVTSFFYFFLPTSLVLLQPDGGSAMVFFGLWIGFLLVSGLRWRHIVVGVLIMLALSLAGWSFLKDYQRERIFAFVNPEYDPQGINYNVIQSKIAIGSGGWFGRGFGQGTQVHLKFLPEPATDFILSAFIEEWGFIGGLFVIGVFMFLIFRIMVIGSRSENNFSRFICIGAVVMFLVQFGLNVGSALGVLPVVGVTFPFFSYGGSSLLTSALLIGIIQSIAVRSSR